MRKKNEFYIDNIVTRRYKNIAQHRIGREVFIGSVRSHKDTTRLGLYTKIEPEWEPAKGKWSE